MSISLSILTDPMVATKKIAVPRMETAVIRVRVKILIPRIALLQKMRRIQALTTPLVRQVLTATIQTILSHPLQIPQAPTLHLIHPQPNLAEKGNARSKQ